jgi:hypothetical protein
VTADDRRALAAGDASRRRALTGPCRRVFAASYREIYDALVAGGI